MNALLKLFAICLWTAGIVCLIVTLARLRQAQQRRRHEDEAIALTQPIGPEDDETFWGQR